MKSFFLFLVIVSSYSFAQTTEQAARRLETLQNPDPKVDCNKHLMTPDEALIELNSSNKTFIGRRNLYGHDQNYTCIYKTSKAYVLYHNCMSNRREYAALDFEVIPFEGDIFGFSLENNNIGLPTTLKRSQYNMNWQVSIEVTEAPGPNLNGEQLNSFLASTSGMLGSCYIGGTFKARDMSLRAQCTRVRDADNAQWEEKATSFWREPSEDWYNAIKEARRRMSSF
jgi:hypothetical protein